MAGSKIPVYCVYNNYGHSPLALGMIICNAKQHAGGLLTDIYDFVPTTLTSEDVAKEVVSEHGPGVFLCSDYLWTSRQNLAIGRLVKQRHPESVLIHGGPSVPKYEDSCQRFFSDHPDVDIAVRGEGEVATSELLERLASRPLGAQRDRRWLADVTGITYRVGKDEIVRTPDRERVQHLDDLPSPYETGWFRDEDAKGWVAAIIETNRGCPYGCTFCDWGSAILSKIRQFSLDRIRRELEWIARHHVNVLWIADANFGIFGRDVEIARMIASCRRQYDAPRQVVVNYAKNATERLAEIIQILHDAGVAADAIISIQTRDPKTLAIIERSNIKTERYEQLIGIFRNRNLPISSDLMMGLPGATVDSFKADLQFFFDRKVHAKAYPTMVLPNSPMAHADYIEKYQIKTDKDGYIVSTNSYTVLDRWTMQSIYLFYRVFVGFSVLKYFLYYLQIDHGVQAITFIDDLQQLFNDRPGALPRTSALLQPMMTRDPANPWIRAMSRWTDEDWGCFQREIMDFVHRKYGITPDSAMSAVLEVQVALTPRKDRILPLRLSVAHDVAAYFQRVHGIDTLSDLDPRTVTRLAEYPPGVLLITDPAGLCDGMEDKTTYDDHGIHWELDSPLRSGGVVPHFVTQV